MYRRLGGAETSTLGRSAEDELLDTITESEVKDAIEALPDSTGALVSLEALDLR